MLYLCLYAIDAVLRAAISGADYLKAFSSPKEHDVFLRFFVILEWFAPVNI